MHFRPLILLASATVALLPCVSNASPEKDALKACAQAFASSVASPGAATPAFTLNYRGSTDESVLTQYYNRKYSFSMQAHDPKSGVTVAAATCSTDARGEKVALVPTSIDAASAKLAAQF
jgi:hypothetical protein